MSRKVLIIEDDFALADIMKALLQKNGYEPHHAADGEAGVAAARKIRPDVVLLDVRLPKMDGYAVCRALRTEEKTKGAKIIMVTQAGLMGEVETAFSAGAHDYLTKPFDSDRLLKKIEKALPH